MFSLESVVGFPTNFYPVVQSLLPVWDLVRPILEPVLANWHIVEGISQAFVFVGLFVIWRGIKNERDVLQIWSRDFKETIERLDEKIETLSQIANAARDAAEAGGPTDGTVNPLGEDDNSPWERVRLKWRELRGRLELAIEGISNKTIRKKYAKIPRYSYLEIISTLRTDGEIYSHNEELLLKLNKAFLKFRARPAAVTEAHAREFLEVAALVDSALPTLKSTVTP